MEDEIGQYDNKTEQHADSGPQLDHWLHPFHKVPEVYSSLVQRNFGLRDDVGTQLVATCPGQVHFCRQGA